MRNKKRLVISLLFVFFIFGVSLPLFITNHKKVKADTISDLTGCTWVGNTNLSLPSEEIGYHINFICQNQNYFTFWVKAYGDNMVIYVDTDYNDIPVYDKEYGSGWVNDDYKTIEITGGSDVTNSALITWLQNNGTLTAPASVGTRILYKYWAPYGIIQMTDNQVIGDNDIQYKVLFNEQRRQYDETTQTGLIFKGMITTDNVPQSYIESVVSNVGINILYKGDSNNLNNVMWLEFTYGDYMDTTLYNFMDLYGYWFDDGEAYIVGTNQGYVEGEIVGRAAGQADGTQYTGLITGIFNGLGGLLSIQVFPNITIGLLIGLPLLLGVLIIIIKLLRG